MSKLWGITAFFGAADRAKRLENFRQFRHYTKEQGLPLVCVELCFPGQQPLLDETQADIYILRRSNSVLWHKEHLLNLARKHLPDDCTSVAWIDCDLVFLNSNWIDDTLATLKKSKVVQLFDTVYRSPANCELVECLSPRFNWDDIPFDYTREEGSQLYGVAYISNIGKRRTYTPGYAWAARREVLEQCGLYDFAIVGGGDQLIADAIYGEKIRSLFYYNCETYEPSLKDYYAKLARVVGGSISYVPGRIIHLNHGVWGVRKYQERGASLSNHHFAPETDLFDDNGVWEWKTDNQKFIEEVKEYFLQRAIDPENDEISET